ncbi:AAA family ATPase [Catalinimonas niigatensis]|uniref:AAA family ATPase n=1 Tax=Catalinimonas niigatensis TaxID=1397264 RepID=UPI0026658D46|nr:ATP-binding protein [Catalinimonas niigatensis]WPP50801.1 ATP-binding protein [Catalinimonas niigatensis]
MIIIIFGLPGTGKSYFGKRLAEHLGLVYINSDRIRKRLQLSGKYGSEEKKSVYEQMLNTTEEQVQQHKGVILDATFSDHSYIQKVKNLAQRHEIPTRLIEMVADEKVIIERVRKTRPYSEADYEVYKKMKANYEAIDETHLILDTSQTTDDQLIQEAIKYLYHD